MLSTAPSALFSDDDDSFFEDIDHGQPSPDRATLQSAGHSTISAEAEMMMMQQPHRLNIEDAEKLNKDLARLRMQHSDVEKALQVCNVRIADTREHIVIVNKMSAQLRGAPNSDQARNNAMRLQQNLPQELATMEADKHQKEQERNRIVRDIQEIEQMQQDFAKRAEIADKKARELEQLQQLQQLQQQAHQLQHQLMQQQEQQLQPYIHELMMSGDQDRIVKLMNNIAKVHPSGEEGLNQLITQSVLTKTGEPLMNQQHMMNANMNGNDALNELIQDSTDHTDVSSEDSACVNIDRCHPSEKDRPVADHNSPDGASIDGMCTDKATSAAAEASTGQEQESVLDAYLKKITESDAAYDSIIKADFSVLCAHLMTLFLALLDYRFSNGIAIALSMLACVSATTFPAQDAILRTGASAAMLVLDIVWIFTDSKVTHCHFFPLIMCLTLFCAWLLCDEKTKGLLEIREPLVAAVDESKFAANYAAAEAAAAAAVAEADAKRGIRTVELARVDGKLGIVLAEYRHIVYIAEVVRGGAADLQGKLRSGDMIIAINGVPFGYQDSTKAQAADVLEKAEDTVKIKVRNYPFLARCEL